MRIYAEARHYFVNIPDKFSNTVENPEPYTFTTANDLTSGTEEPLVEYNYTLAYLRKSQLPNTLNYALPHPVRIGATPGFEIVAFIIAVAVVFFIYKHKKKDKKT
jgi:hypothetical protein